MARPDYHINQRESEYPMTTSAPKGFWALDNMKPDSIGGKALLLGGVTAFAIYGLPVLKVAMWNLVSIIGAAYAIGAGVAGLAIIGYILVDGKLVRLADYVFRLGVRALVGFFIPLDPIGIMKNYLDDVKKTIANFSDHISSLRGSIDQAKADRETFKAEYEAAMAEVAAYRRKGLETDPDASTAANVANRRQGSIKDLEKLIVQMEAILGILERYFKKSVAYRDDLDDTITFEARRRKAIKSAYGAFMASKRILAGNDVGAEFSDMALEAMQEQAASMVGEMKQWAFESQGMLKTFEMKEAAAVELALARVEEQERSGGSLLLEYNPGQLAPVIDGKEAVPVEKPNVSADIERFLKN
jgi:hypothetical protein